MSIRQPQNDFGLTRTGETRFFSLPGEGPVPEILSGAVLENVNAPEYVAAGEPFNVTGTAAFDCTHCVAPRDVRIGIDSSHHDSQVSEVHQMTGGGIAPGESQFQFSFEFVAPPDPGISVSLRLDAQRSLPDVGIWYTDNSETHDVEVVTEDEATRRSVANYAPWVVGGGAIGVGGAYLLEESIVGGGAAGVGAGVAAKVISGQGGIIPDLSFPTVPVLALAGLFGAGALLLGRLPDISNIPIPGTSGTSGGGRPRLPP